jgi:lysophospholipase L1-like esterase
MKKRLFALILAVCVTMSVTACDNTQNASSVASGTSTTESKEESKEESSATETSGTESSAPETSGTESATEDNTSETPMAEVYEAGGDITKGMKDISLLNAGNKVRLAKVLKKLAAGEEVTIGFIGGSITQGSSAGNELCYAKLTYDWFGKAYPETKINYVNAGIGATGSYIGVHRVTNDLLSKNPDLVFVEFSVNDTTENTQRNIESYDSLLRTIWGYETSPAIITIATVQENGTSFQQYHYDIVKKYDLPMISYGDAILSVIKKGDIAWKDISDDNIHPNVEGHNALSQMLTAYIEGVTAELDSITGDESDFTVKATTAGFENGKLLTPLNTEPAENNGFMKKDGNFGGFNGTWIALSTTAKPYTDDTNLTFEVEAKSIGLLYGKLTTASATSAEIYIDGELATTINSAFPGGWGNYVECAHIKSFNETGKHTVKIVPKTRDGGAAFYVSALAIS